MKRLGTIVATLTVLALFAIPSWATDMGAISTDRFGYTGTVRRYASLPDAQSGNNQVGSDIAIGNRDLALYIINDSDYDTNYNIIMGSWWYSTDNSGSAGYGNTTGNSGRGFLQLYDEDGSTDSSVDFAFSGWDGTYWTGFSLSLSGVNANYPDDYARFWVDYQGGGADRVIYHSYDLVLSAGGLQGVENTTTGLIQAWNHPTSVTGTYSGIFENVSTTYAENNGFYAFDLELDMDNWAFDNQNLLTYPTDGFNDSYFEASNVPEPGTLAFFAAAGVLGLAVRYRRRK